MSVNVRAVAIVGLRFDPRNLVVSANVRACSHGVGDLTGEMRFCPVCGERLHVRRHCWISGFKELKWKSGRAWQHTLDGVPLHVTFDRPESIDDLECGSVAYLCETGGITDDLLSGASPVVVPSSDNDMRSMICGVAAKYGLWNPETHPESYGLHIFGSVS